MGRDQNYDIDIMYRRQAQIWAEIKTMTQILCIVDKHRYGPRLELRHRYYVSQTSIDMGRDQNHYIDIMYHRQAQIWAEIRTTTQILCIVDKHRYGPRLELLHRYYVSQTSIDMGRDQNHDIDIMYHRQAQIWAEIRTTTQILCIVDKHRYGPRLELRHRYYVSQTSIDMGRDQNHYIDIMYRRQAQIWAEIRTTVRHRIQIQQLHRYLVIVWLTSIDRG